MARAVRYVAVVVLTAATFAGICVAGVTVSMRQSFPAAPVLPALPPPAQVPAGRQVVAVALGASGSVVADALLPYEVFARSDRFAVYAVAARRTPLALSGGLHVVPDYTFDAGPVPDVVVVPAVVDPAETPLLEWVARQARRGARVLGVCAGSHVLAEAGVLDGRQATEFWANISARRRTYPAVRWLRGHRYVSDGPVTTTAGVTSGVAGALHVITQLAGPAEANRIGRELAYPGWAPDAPTAIPAQRIGAGDAPYALGAAFPWARPTIGVGLTDGVSESSVAAAFELYSATSFANRTIPLAAGRTVTTRHGLHLTAVPANANAPEVDRLVLLGRSGTLGPDGTLGPGGALEPGGALSPGGTPGPGGTSGPGVMLGPGAMLWPGDPNPALSSWAASRDIQLTTLSPNGFPFDSVLRDLAAHTDRATARTTAKYTEYPAPHLTLTGPAWPWRPTAFAAIALLTSAAAAVALTALARRLTARAASRTPKRHSASAEPTG